MAVTSKVALAPGPHSLQVGLLSPLSGPHPPSTGLLSHRRAAVTFHHYISLWVGSLLALTHRARTKHKLDSSCRNLIKANFRANRANSCVLCVMAMEGSQHSTLHHDVRMRISTWTLCHNLLSTLI